MEGAPGCVSQVQRLRTGGRAHQSQNMGCAGGVPMEQRAASLLPQLRNEESAWRQCIQSDTRLVVAPWTPDHTHPVRTQHRRHGPPAGSLQTIAQAGESDPHDHGRTSHPAIATSSRGEGVSSIGAEKSLRKCGNALHAEEPRAVGPTAKRKPTVRSVEFETHFI